MMKTEPKWPALDLKEALLAGPCSGRQKEESKKVPISELKERRIKWQRSRVVSHVERGIDTSLTALNLESPA